MKSNLYANGVASALSNSLITKETYARMIEAKNYNEALDVLSETSFGSGVENENITSREDILNFETKKLINFVKTESPLKEFEEYFLLTFDYANISSFCKCQSLGVDFLPYVEAEGIYTTAQIKEYILSKQYNNFNNPFIKQALVQFDKIESLFSDGWEVDFIFKKYMYKNLLKLCSKYNILKELITNKIDAENLSVAMRATTHFQFEGQLLDGGNLNKQTLQKVFNKQKDAVNDIKNDTIKQLAKLCLTKESSSYSKFEVIKNTLELRLFSEKQFEIETIAPFAMYVFKSLTQIKNVRLILSYQFNNLKDNIASKFLEVKSWKIT